MKTTAGYKRNHGSRAVANSHTETAKASAQGLFFDNRPETVTQGKIQDFNIRNSTIQNALQPIQRLSKASYISGDGWVDLWGYHKPGAEKKWNHLIDLYTRAANIINADVKNYAQKEIGKLQEVFNSTIGFSEYDKTLKTLNDIHEVIDRKRLISSNSYQDEYTESLKGFYEKSCRIIESEKVAFEGNEKFKSDSKAVLCKIYASDYGKKIIDQILNIVENPETPNTIKFIPGAENQAIYDPEGTTVELDLGLKDYASGKDGDIIPNSVEIVIVHEFGHLLNNIKGPRGMPKTPYSKLKPEAQALWSNEEEYINITQIENQHRKSLKLPARLYHAGDPLIHTGHEELKFIFDNHEELNLALLKRAADGDTSILLTETEIADFKFIRERIKAGRVKETDDVVTLRAFIRKHLAKITEIKQATRARGLAQTREWGEKTQAALKINPDWKNKLIPLIAW